MPMATVKQVKTLVRSTEEALDKLNRTDITYKFGVQFQLPTQVGLTLEQVKTCVRKLEEALSAFKDDAPLQFGMEVAHASEIDTQIIEEANKIFEAKTGIVQKPAIVTADGQPA